MSKKIIVDSPELKCIKIIDLNYDKIDNEFEVEFTMYDILEKSKIPYLIKIIEWM